MLSAKPPLRKRGSKGGVGSHNRRDSRAPHTGAAHTQAGGEHGQKGSGRGGHAGTSHGFAPARMSLGASIGDSSQTPGLARHVFDPGK